MAINFSPILPFILQNDTTHNLSLKLVRKFGLAHGLYFPIFFFDYLPGSFQETLYYQFTLIRSPLEDRFFVYLCA